jgi:hypothetical protein
MCFLITREVCYQNTCNFPAELHGSAELKVNDTSVGQPDLQWSYLAISMIDFSGIIVPH